MNESSLSAGQFAKLARTTKRTVLWYDQKGVLKPQFVDESGYRFYAPRQILDFQGVSLMRKLGFSIDEIALLLSKDRTMPQLFEEQRGALERQIGFWQRTLEDINHYYENLHNNGTLVKPVLKQVESFDMYYLAKQGPYARIKDYHNELCDAFESLPDDCVFLTAFMVSRYQPMNAAMKVGVVYRPEMKLKPHTKVQRETVPRYTALAYVHVGSTTLLSLLWQELGKYRQQHHLEADTTLPFGDIELYTPDTSEYPDPEDSLTTELHIPVIRPR